MTAEKNSDDFQLKRLYDWLMDEKREPANTKFTAGLLRNVASEIEFRLRDKALKEMTSDVFSDSFYESIENPKKGSIDFSKEKETAKKILDKAKKPTAKWMRDETK